MKQSNLLTEGGNDAGVDGLHIGEIEDGEFLQYNISKVLYTVNDLNGDANFPENGVQKAVNTVGVLILPGHIELNPLIKPKVEEIRSLVHDGYIPNVRVILCNNGIKWNRQAQSWIDQSGFPKDQVQWFHFNHDSIVQILRRTKSVDDILRFSGSAVIDEFNYRRVLVGKVSCLRDC